MWIPGRGASLIGRAESAGRVGVAPVAHEREAQVVREKRLLRVRRDRRPEMLLALAAATSRRRPEPGRRAINLGTL